MDALADLPRKLLAHILEHWAPISIGELASVSQVLSTSISPQLKRLELDGLIEKTTLHGTTRSGYQVAERFFNIWYLMRFSTRRQRSRLTWLVEFMRLWFSSDELCTIAQKQMWDGRTALLTSHDREYDCTLADAAQGGDRAAFLRIKEQVLECHELGLGERLADWMAESEAAGFLAPFIQALYTLAGAEGKLRDLPLECQQMVDEIVRLGRLRKEKT
jgi:hypothetical protein